MALKIMLIGMLTLSSAFGAEHQIIDTLGASPKGQYVALEEYGYKADKHAYYVVIKVMNVWKKEYVGSAVKVEIPAHRPDFLKKARSQAKLMAQDQLKKFEINFEKI